MYIYIFGGVIKGLTLIQMTLQLHEFWHPNAENFGMRVACSNFNMSLCYFNEWSVICHFSCNQSGKSLSLMQVTNHDRCQSWHWIMIFTLSISV